MSRAEVPFTSHWWYLLGVRFGW